MKRTLFIICLGFLIAVFGLQSAFAKDPPISAEQLRSEFEAALKAKDTNAVMSLYNWRGVSDEAKSSQIETVTINFFDQKIENVKLIPLTSNYSAEDEWETDNGLVIFNPNIPTIGMIEVKSQPANTNIYPHDDGSVMSFPYGKTNNAFYFVGAVMQKVPRTALKEKSLNIIVTIWGGNYSATGDVTSLELTTFTGSCIYIKNGKEIKADISGSASHTNIFLGGYVKSCTVQKTSGKGWVNLKILEDGRKVFGMESQLSGEGIAVEGGENSKEPISYEIPKFQP